MAAQILTLKLLNGDARQVYKRDKSKKYTFISKIETLHQYVRLFDTFRKIRLTMMLPVRALESSDGGESTFPDRDKNVLPPLRQNKIAMTPDKANFVLHNLCSLHGDIRKSQQSENLF